MWTTVCRQTGKKATTGGEVKTKIGEGKEPYYAILILSKPLTIWWLRSLIPNSKSDFRLGFQRMIITDLELTQSCKTSVKHHSTVFQDDLTGEVRKDNFPALLDLGDHIE